MSDVTIDRMMEVMQAHKNGAKVQYSYIGENSWVEAEGPLWNWAAYTYRVAPKEYTQEEAKALDEEVQRLKAQLALVVPEDEWITNTSKSDGIPYGLAPGTAVSVLFNYGDEKDGIADHWHLCWNTTSIPYIAKYRIVK